MSDWPKVDLGEEAVVLAVPRLTTYLTPAEALALAEKLRQVAGIVEYQKNRKQEGKAA